MTKVSILMNGYNAQSYLKEAIDSVYAQTFNDWEIIFIDNCSTDDTKNIIDTYNEKIKYYKTDLNIPLGAARNFGLKYCNAKYIAFLDTDDMWLENKLDIQVKAMDENLEFQLCYGGVIYIDEKSKKIGKMIPVATSGDVFARQLRRYEINMQSVMLRNNEKIMFDETLSHSPDFDLFMTLASKTKVCVLKDFLVKYRKVANSLTSKNIDVWWIEMKKTLDKIFSEDIQLKKIYLKEYNIAYAKVAYNRARHLINIDKITEARKELTKFKLTTYQYFIIYIVSIFPIKVWNFVHRFK